MITFGEFADLLGLASLGFALLISATSAASRWRKASAASRRTRSQATNPAATGAPEAGQSIRIEHDFASAILKATSAKSATVLSSSGGKIVLRVAFDREPRSVICKAAALDRGRGAMGLFAEAQALTYLHSAAPGIAPQLFSTETLGERILAMYREDYDGTDLHRQLRRCATESQWPSIGEASAVSTAVAAMTARLHDAGVVHGDLKPANVLFRFSGESTVRFDSGPVLIDFDSSRVPLGQASAPRSGTPGFAPPERYFSTPPDRRSDVYSLGALVAFIFVGQPGLTGMSAGKRIPQEIRSTLDRAMSWNPSERYETAVEFHQDLQQAVSTMDRSRRRQRLDWPAGWQELPERLLTQTIAVAARAAPHQLPALPRASLTIDVADLALPDSQRFGITLLGEFLESQVSLDELAISSNLSLEELTRTLNEAARDLAGAVRHRVAQADPSETVDIEVRQRSYDSQS